MVPHSLPASIGAAQPRSAEDELQGLVTLVTTMANH
jgi:hypothetical protein